MCCEFAELAQLVEHLPRKEKVASSTLAFSIRVLQKVCNEAQPKVEYSCRLFTYYADFY